MVMQPIKYAEYNFPCWPHLQVPTLPIDFFICCIFQTKILAKSYILPL